jgi:hypothetical protein
MKFIDIIKKKILISLRIEDPSYYRRRELSDYFNRYFKSTVQYGLFKGLKLEKNTWWGRLDRASMIFGIYEKEVLDYLGSIRKKYKCFIDLGAADGYYGVGVIVSNLFEHSYCFEKSEIGRQVIKNNAQRNGVTDNLSVFGYADENFFNCIKKYKPEECLLFCDIEGGEFNLFSDEVLNYFRNSTIIIEIHDWLVDNGEFELSKLKERASTIFNINALTTGSRDLSHIRELDSYGDTDRWLLCSENRMRRMQWLVLTPR